MADEHDNWLDRDAAERLLRGEPLKAVTDDDIRQAGRLAAAFDALTATPSGPGGELPGEEAALKAFREARAFGEARATGAIDDAVDRIVPAAGGTDGRGRTDGAGRAGRTGRGAGPLWRRPVRFGLTAALAACMVGGVAVAAGTGVLPSPFGGSGAPAPAASVSGVASPHRPLISRAPDAGDRDEAQPDGSATPDGSGPPGAGNGGVRQESKGLPRPSAPGATKSDEATEGVRGRLIEACLRYRSGELGADERRRLRGSAKKYGRDRADLGRYCDRVLDRSDGSTTFHGPDGADGSDGRPDGANGPGGSGEPSGPDGHHGGTDGDEDSGIPGGHNSIGTGGHASGGTSGHGGLGGGGGGGGGDKTGAGHGGYGVLKSGHGRDAANRPVSGKGPGAGHEPNADKAPHAGRGRATARD